MRTLIKLRKTSKIKINSKIDENCDLDLDIINNVVTVIH